MDKQQFLYAKKDDGREFYPHELTTNQLRNAIAFAKIHGSYIHIGEGFWTTDRDLGVDGWVWLSWDLRWIEAFEAELKKREGKGQ
jgi:hypothetical protein